MIRRPSRTRRAAAASALALALALAFGVALAPVALAATRGGRGHTGKPARGPALDGYGATLGSFARAHAPANCPLGGCYGAHVASPASPAEFSELSLLKGRVVGYDQALPPGTPLLQAELMVAKLFPADATQSSVEVVRHDYYHHRCAFYDISSKSLDHLFGSKALGGNGNVGVELLTVGASDVPGYNSHNINLAIIVPTWVNAQDNC